MVVKNLSDGIRIETMTLKAALIDIVVVRNRTVPTIPLLQCGPIRCRGPLFVVGCVGVAASTGRCHLLHGAGARAV